MWKRVLTAAILALSPVAALPRQDSSMRTTPKPNVCKENGIYCSPPPKHHICYLFDSTNTEIEATLGDLKDCCPVFVCYPKDAAVLYIGISHNRIPKSTTTTTTTEPLPVPPMRPMGRSFGNEDIQSEDDMMTATKPTKERTTTAVSKISPLTTTSKPRRHPTKKLAKAITTRSTTTTGMPIWSVLKEMSILPYKVIAKTLPIGPPSRIAKMCDFVGDIDGKGEKCIVLQKM